MISFTYTRTQKQTGEIVYMYTQTQADGEIVYMYKQTQIDREIIYMYTQTQADVSDTFSVVPVFPRLPAL